MAVSSRRVLLALDFGGTKTAVAVCDPAGNRLAGAVVDSLGHRGARASFDQAVATARRLLAAAGGATLAAVGVSTFGIPHADRVDLAPAIDGWSGFALGRALRAAFDGVSVAMMTDVKAAACAEARWGALAGCDPGVYLNLGTGLAAAVVSGGRVISGRHGAAGEIGYSLRSPADVGLPAGHRTTLEEAVSGLGLQRQASASGRPLTAAEVFAASAGDPALGKLVTAFVEELAYHLVNLAILVDPERIAVGGGMVRSFGRIRPRLAEALTRGVPFPPELVPARHPYDAPLIGAIALAADAASAAGSAAPGFVMSDDNISEGLGTS